jgi:2-hydroxymethylglutarate dehydrogenase
MKVGFIGLGNIGLPVASNLLKGGHELIVYDARRERMEMIIPSGARGARSPREVAMESEVVFTSLPNPKVCEEVMLGDDGVLAGAPPGLIHVELSTTSPSLMRRIGAMARAKGVEVLDAGITKGVTHAEAGKSTIIVGGSEYAVNKVRPLLNLMADRIFHAGEIGSGMTVKLINNLMGLVNLATMCEGLALGVKAGISPSLLYEAISHGSGDSFQWRERGKRILKRKLQGGGITLELACKDFELITELARDQNFPLYMTSIAHQLYQHALAKGIMQQDRTSLILLWEELLGKEIAE